MFCRMCGKEIIEGSLSCNHCGTLIVDDTTSYVIRNFCTKCGSQIVSVDGICLHCLKNKNPNKAAQVIQNEIENSMPENIKENTIVSKNVLSKTNNNYTSKSNSNEKFNKSSVRKKQGIFDDGYTPPKSSDYLDKICYDSKYRKKTFLKTFSELITRIEKGNDTEAIIMMVGIFILIIVFVIIILAFMFIFFRRLFM